MTSSANPGETELVWTNVPESWGLFVLLAVLAALFYAVFALYWREKSAISQRRKATLIVLRAGALFLLGAIFLGPSLVEVQHRIVKPGIVVLRDASQSMNTADRYDNAQIAEQLAELVDRPPAKLSSGSLTRAQLTDSLLNSTRIDFVEQLTAKGRLELFDFADQAVPASSISQSGATVPPLKAYGRTTDLAAAIRQALTTHPLAAVVVFTDGQHTAASSVQSAIQQSAQRVPLFLVGIGDSTRRANVRVTSVYAPPQAWPGEPFEVEAVISVQDIDPGSLRLELLQRPAGEVSPAAPASIVQSLPLSRFVTGSGQQTIPLTHTVADSGQYQYEVRVTSSALPEASDNPGVMSNVVNVLNRQQLRVLLVAGSPSWDYQLLHRLLARDRTLTVSTWLQTLDEGRPQEGTHPISQLPRTKEELYFYDVILLLDPDPQPLDAAWFELLHPFVAEHAGGVLYMAGPKHTSRLLSSQHATPLAGLFPVTFGDLAATEVTSLLSASAQAWPLQVVPAASDHPLLRVAAENQTSQQTWQSLPGVFWTFPSKAARPTAEVLLEHSDPSVQTDGRLALLVAGRYGAGHTVYMGFGDTWRWRKVTQPTNVFDQFWIQAVRFLAGARSLAGQRRATLQADREVYELGQRVTLRARLLDPSYEPLVVPQIAATLAAIGPSPTSPETIPLAPVEGRPGTYEATFAAKQTGMHRVAIELPGTDASQSSIDATFRVELPSAEAAHTWLNRPLLRELASMTGGRYFEAWEVQDLAAAIPDQTEKIVSRGPPRPLWDTGITLAALVGLLCCEWLLRKRSGLV